MLSSGKAYQKTRSSDTKKLPSKVSVVTHQRSLLIKHGNLNLTLTSYIDKERYIKELRDLTKCNKTLDKPKKPLTPYMLFVREVSL